VNFISGVSFPRCWKYLVARFETPARTGAHQTIGPGHPPPNWLDSPYGFDVAVRSVVRVLERIRPPGSIIPPKLDSPAQTMLAEAIADGLLADLARDIAAGDFMEGWAAGLRDRLGHLCSRLSADYILGARSVSLPTATSPGIIMFDTDDLSMLEPPEAKEDQP
jgi:hypothetical protein